MKVFNCAFNPEEINRDIFVYQLQWFGNMISISNYKPWIILKNRNKNRFFNIKLVNFTAIDYSPKF